MDTCYPWIPTGNVFFGTTDTRIFFITRGGLADLMGRQSTWAGGVPMHYSNAAAAALE